MKFESISIKNFRNFEDVEICLKNKNILFGMNDVGKTNFLYALRFVFDKEIRKNGFVDTDYNRKNTNNPIEITVVLDIEDEDNDDSQKLRAKIKGGLLTGENKVFIKLVGEYDKKEMIGTPMLFWGGNLYDLDKMKLYGYRFEIDYVFNVFYIDAYVDLYSLFRKNINILLMNDSENDKKILEEIESNCKMLNEKISNLSGIKAFEEKVKPEYKKYRHEDISVAVKSEIAIKGLYSNVVPYIRRDSDEELYPTSGEGRKKLLVYSVFDILAKETEENKINIFLIEEPENHLHKSMQMALSHVLFMENKYPYLFLTTHSSYVLLEMDNINLVRIYNADKIVSKSTLYNVPKIFQNQRKMLNKGMVEAIFADKVLLVEGPSENVLFSKVLEEINPLYEADGTYILSVGGFGFDIYAKILNDLEIFNAIKTDNDLRKPQGKNYYSVLGFSRVNKLINQAMLPENPVFENSVYSKRLLYDENKDVLDEIRKTYFVFLSRCSLEEDLDEVIHNEMIKYLPSANGDAIKYLQEAKNKHMVELAEKLTKEDCLRIFNHYNFECLKEFV